MLKSVNPYKEESILKRKAFWSFFGLFFAWLFYFWPIVYPIFGSNKPWWITLSTYGITLTTIYLIYARRDVLKNTLLASSQLGLLTLFIFAAIFIFANVIHIQYVEQSAVMLMIPALVLTAFGSMVTQTILFPLLYLMLIIPLQDNALQYRSVIVWAAIFALIVYLRYLRIHKPKTSVEGERPAWAFQNARWLVPTGIAFVVLMVSPWLGENVRSFYPLEHMEIVMRTPLGTGSWTGPSSVQGQAWAPLYPNASAIVQAQYFSNSTYTQGNVYLYSAYFGSDRSFSEIFDPKNAIFNPSLWKKIDFKMTEVDLGKENIINVFEVELRAGAVSRLVWYWYYVAGVSTTDLTLADFLDKVRTIAKYAQGSGIVAVSTHYDVSPEEARKRLRSFLEVMYGSLNVLKRPEITYTQYSHLGT